MTFSFKSYVLILLIIWQFPSTGLARTSEEEPDKILSILFEEVEAEIPDRQDWDEKAEVQRVLSDENYLVDYSSCKHSSELKENDRSRSELERLYISTATIVQDGKATKLDKCYFKNRYKPYIATRDDSMDRLIDPDTNSDEDDEDDERWNNIMEALRVERSSSSAMRPPSAPVKPNKVTHKKVKRKIKERSMVQNQKKRSAFEINLNPNNTAFQNFIKLLAKAENTRIKFNKKINKLAEAVENGDFDSAKNKLNEANQLLRKFEKKLNTICSHRFVITGIRNTSNERFLQERAQLKAIRKNDEPIDIDGLNEYEIAALQAQQANVVQIKRELNDDNFLSDLLLLVELPQVKEDL